MVSWPGAPIPESTVPLAPGSLALALLTVHAAHAIDPDQLAELRWQLDRGQTLSVAQSTAAALHDGQIDPAWVSLHAEAVTLRGEGTVLEASLTDDDTPAASLALASSWLVDGPDCTALEAHTRPEAVAALPPPWAWELASVRLRAARQGCSEISEDDALRAILEMEPPGWRTADALALQLPGPVDTTWARQVERHLATHPRDLTALGNPWRADATGPGLVAARVALASAAEQALTSDDPVRAARAAQVLVWRDGPTPEPEGPRPPTLLELSRQLDLAASRLSPRKRLALLSDLDGDLPATGPARARWHAERARAFSEQGRAAKTVDALEAAWRAEPTRGERARTFGLAAAQHRRNLAAAEHALDTALALPAPYRAHRGGPQAHDAFRARHTDTRARWHEARGAVRLAQGNVSGARADLDHALVMSPTPSASMWLRAGLASAASTESLPPDAEAALVYLARGLSHPRATLEHPELVSQARPTFETVWQQHRWLPGGPEQWRRALQASAAQDVPTDGVVGIVDLDEFADALGPSGPSLPLVGLPLPDVVVMVADGPRHLRDTERWLVVDLWATWCDPCRPQLAALAALAEHLPDTAPLEVVAVSIDKAPPTTQPNRTTAITWAWSGPRLSHDLATPGLPTTLLVSPQGTVVAGHAGWDGDLSWLERALHEEGVLHDTSAPAPNP